MHNCSISISALSVVNYRGFLKLKAVDEKMKAICYTAKLLSGN
jgi:hypothetical protein